MQIEVLTEELGTITGFRMEWSDKAKNPPNPSMVFDIARDDVIPLAEFLAGRSVLVSDSSKYDANFGNLYLLSLDDQDPSVFTDDAFFEHFRK